MEVVYEWLLYFCSHCQNLRHEVTSCRWLYPQKDKKEANETTVKGKIKQVTVTKLDWVPNKSNPSSIGSSRAFEAPPKLTPQSIVPINATTNAHNESPIAPTPDAQVEQHTQ